MEEGVRKRVGDGRSIDIWKDRWIAGTRDGKVGKQPTLGCWETKVKELIIQGQWNKDLLQKLFDENIQKEILRIPLSSNGLKDRIYWVWTANGDYTVKSGYHLSKSKGENRTREEKG